MKFVDNKLMLDYIIDVFDLEYGNIFIFKACLVDVESTAYLFSYGPPYVRNGKKIKFSGEPGIYVLLIRNFNSELNSMKKDIELWYGGEIEKVINYVELESSVETAMLAKVVRTEEIERMLS